MKKAGHTHARTRKSRQNFGKNRDFVPIGLKLFDLEENINIFRGGPKRVCVGKMGFGSASPRCS